METDVLVVGASPAGLSAAREAAVSGAEVLLIDGKSSLEEYHPANTFFLSMWRRTGLPFPHKCITHRLEGMDLVSPGGHELGLDLEGYAINRPEFDRWLIDRVTGAGGEVRTGVKATGLLRGDGGSINGVKCSDGEICARVTVLACGINSNLVAKTGLQPMQHPGDVAWAREAVCTAPGAGEASRFRYYLGSNSPGWKATFSPLGGDNIGIGVYVRGHGTDVGNYFRKHMKRVSDELGQKPKVLKTWECGDPIFTIPEELTGNGLALAGGCAGQSGIAFGIVAGGICGRVAAKTATTGGASYRGLGEYPRLWKKTLGANYRQGRFALEFVRRLRDDELDRVARLFTKRGLNHLPGKSMPGLTLSIINTCLHEDPAALCMLKAFTRG